MKFIKILAVLMTVLWLGACEHWETALLMPEADYVKLGNEWEKVNTLESSNAITVVGSSQDENGNRLLAYPSPDGTAHKKVRLSPPPDRIRASCERTFFVPAPNGGFGHGRVSGYGSVKGVYEAGKTYRVFCNRQGGGMGYKVVAREVPAGSEFNIASPKGVKPNDTNRVRFVITGKSSTKFWRWANDEYMSITNWSGKQTDKAEWAAPIDHVIVECQMPRGFHDIGLPRFRVNGDFKAGHTYRLACRYNADKQLEAYVAEEM